MNKKENLDFVKNNLPLSVVFPKHIISLLLKFLPTFSDKQLKLLAQILQEEQERLEKI